MFGPVRSFVRHRKWAMSSSVQASAGTNSQGPACENGLSWNKTADNLVKVSHTTLKYGIDALEIAGVSPGDKMLDVATGAGELALYAASKKGATVDAIDFASENIANLQRSLQGHPLSVTGHVMDGQQLEFSDDCFDIVSSCFGVFLFPDYMKGVKEMFRVTRPGGRVAVVAWAVAGRARLRPCMQLLETHFPEVLPLPMPPGVPKMANVEGMKEVLEAGGYECVTVSEVAHDVPVPDPEAFANMHLQNPVIGVGLGRLTPEQRGEFVPKFIELLKSEYMKGDTITYEAVAVIGYGTKPSR